MPQTGDTRPRQDRVQLSEAARILGVSADTVRRWGDSGYLRMWRSGPARIREFSRTDIENRQTQHATPVQTPPDDRDQPAAAHG